MAPLTAQTGLGGRVCYTPGLPSEAPAEQMGAREERPDEFPFSRSLLSSRRVTWLGQTAFLITRSSPPAQQRTTAKEPVPFSVTAELIFLIFGFDFSLRSIRPDNRDLALSNTHISAPFKKLRYL